MSDSMSGAAASGNPYLVAAFQQLMAQYQQGMQPTPMPSTPASIVPQTPALMGQGPMGSAVSGGAGAGPGQLPQALQGGLTPTMQAPGNVPLLPTHSFSGAPSPPGSGSNPYAMLRQYGNAGATANTGNQSGSFNSQLLSPEVMSLLRSLKQTMATPTQTKGTTS